MTAEAWYMFLVLEALLVAAPFIYAAFRTPSPGNYEYQPDMFIVLCLCWGWAALFGLGVVLAFWESL